MPLAPLPSAFDALELFPAGARPAVFLDYDGTLTPIVSRPELATLAPAMRAVIVALSEVAEVAVVTGRDLDDAIALVGVPGITIVGSHGFEVERADGERLVLGGGETYLPALEAAAMRVERGLRSIAGTHLERKRFALAVHFRQAPERADEVVTLLDEAARDEPGLRLTHGKMVAELRPAADWHKGRVVVALTREAPQDTPIAYLGDDVTDEDAFEALGEFGDAPVTVIVGERASAATAARWALPDVDAVRRWLQALDQRLRAA